MIRGVLVVVAIALAAHAVTLGNGLVFDDKPGVRDNPVVQGPLGAGLLRRDFWGRPPGPGGVGTWRPVPVASFWLDRRVGGGRAWAFHLTNVLAHAFAAAALFAALAVQRVRRRTALATAALFAVMTVNSEAVAEIVGRADVLAAGFSFLAWALFGPPDAPPGRARLIGGAAALFAALLCKESAVAFAVFLLLCGRPRLVSWRTAAIGAAVALAVAARTACFALPGEALQRSWNNNPLLIEPWWVRALTACRLTLMALRTTLVPLNLSPDWAYAEILPDRSPWAADVLFGALAVALVAAAIVVASRRRPAIAAGLLLFAVSWGSVSNVAVALPTIFAERLLYAPAAGVAVALVALLELAEERGRRRLAIGAFALLFAGNALLTVRRDREWRDDLTLFSAAVETTPKSVRVLTNHGAALVDAGRPALAIASLEKALALAPDSAPAHAYLGAALDGAGQPQAAFDHLSRAAALGPELPAAHYNLAVFLARHGRPAEAIAVLEAFLARQPESGRERELLGRLRQ